MLQEPRYFEGLRLFSAGDWFEAHEVLEALWREQPAGEGRLFLQGLIQLAVSLEHWRRGNARSARGQWEKGRKKLEQLPGVYEGLALGRLLDDFAAFYRAVDLERWVETGLPADPGSRCQGAPIPLLRNRNP